MAEDDGGDPKVTEPGAEPAKKVDTSTPEDVNALIAENTKYHKRAQVAEVELAKLKSEQDGARETQLKEQQKFEQLYGEAKAKLDEVQPIIDNYRADEKAEREMLLKDLSEEDTLIAESIKTVSSLRAFVKRISDEKETIKLPGLRPGAPKVGDKLASLADISKAYINREITTEQYLAKKKQFEAA